MMLFRLDEGTLGFFGHRWDYETWTRDTWKIWATWYNAPNDEWWVDLGGES
jgi:hypothetical protein